MLADLLCSDGDGVACVGITRWKSMKQQVAFEMADGVDIPYVSYALLVCTVVFNVHCVPEKRDHVFWW